MMNSNDITKTPYGAIKVPLAIVWSKPNEEPIYKDICARAATNTQIWGDSLTTDERLWLVDKVNTMVLYGERVVLLDRQGDWRQVAVISQKTIQNHLGYPGWVLADHVHNEPTFLNNQQTLPEAVITASSTTLYADAALTQHRIVLSYQTRLPVLAENENYLKVDLPGGAEGYLSPKAVKKSEELYSSAENIIKEAEQFLGLKYLWGGTSSAGFDCSGFMFRLYQSQGITIPRDASEQAKAGLPIPKENILPGDLLFFATENHPDKIHHVGMHCGDGLMIHSPNSRSAIRSEPFETGVYGREFWGARRYFPVLP